MYSTWLKAALWLGAVVVVVFTLPPARRRSPLTAFVSCFVLFVVSGRVTLVVRRFITEDDLVAGLVGALMVGLVAGASFYLASWLRRRRARALPVARAQTGPETPATAGPAAGL